MYVLVNTMSQIPGDSLGTIVSMHRTLRATQAADDRLQRMTRRANGPNSYVPTLTLEVRGRHRVGQHLSPYATTTRARI